MKTYLSIIAASALLLVTSTSCKKKGCMDQDAVNYNSEAKKDDGTCKYIPTITVNGNNPENINVGDTYTDAGATATNKDGSSDQCNGIQKLSLAHDLLSLASSNF